jgi:signal peptide peptidase SppA
MYERILAEVYTSLWCVRLDKLTAIVDVIRQRASGIHTDAASLEAFAADNRRRAGGRQVGAIAVLPIVGSIVHRGNMFTEASGTSSSDILGKQFDSLVANPDIGAIILDMDSPGGQAAGTPELAAKIAGARGTKPIITHVNTEAASAAYWIASAADEIVCTPSGEVGSIGCYAVHVDRTKQNEMLGVSPTYISYGEFKVEGNPDAPLEAEALAQVQANVDRIGKQFEGDVAKYRGVSLSTVREQWGQGRMVDAQCAKSLGMIDKIGTLEETIGRIAEGKRITRRPAAEKLSRFLRTCY